MTNRRMWGRKTVDESGPLYEFHIDGEGDGQGVGEKTPPRPPDSLKSASPDPVLERTVTRYVAGRPEQQSIRIDPRYQVKGGFGGKDPIIHEEDMDRFGKEYDAITSGWDDRLRQAGIDPEGEFSEDDQLAAGVPIVPWDVVEQIGASLQNAGINPEAVTPDFLESEFGLSREQAFMLGDDLVNWVSEQDPGQDWGD
jgi:hypothetical protein